MRAARFVLGLACLGLFPTLAAADVTVRNTAGRTIEVQAEDGDKSSLRHGDKIVFASKRNEVKIVVYNGSKEVASATVRNGKAVRVTSSSGVWGLTND